MAIFPELENYSICHSFSSILEIVNFAASDSDVNHTVSSADSSVQITSYLYAKKPKNAKYVHIGFEFIKSPEESLLMFNVSLIDVKQKKHFTNCKFTENGGKHSA